MSRTRTCRSCDAPIRWATSLARRRPMPLDVEPAADGTIRLLSDGTALTLTRAELADARAAGVALYRSHYASCPNAAQHRRR